MSNVDKAIVRGPKAAFSDFDFLRITIDFIGDLAATLNALLTLIRNILNFPA